VSRQQRCKLLVADCKLQQLRAAICPVEKEEKRREISNCSKNGARLFQLACFVFNEATSVAAN